MARVRFPAAAPLGIRFGLDGDRGITAPHIMTGCRTDNHCSSSRGTQMETLRHNGILVIEPPEPHGLSITVRGKRIRLNRIQEQMAIAWVKKLGTPYVEDPVFVSNFMKDFSAALGFNPPLSVDEVDFSEVIEFVEAERAARESMTKEEKKAARERRKAERERLKEQYGYAIVDGEMMELATYMTEPSSIFMGRGKHPLRGRWKEGARHEDITLNLDPEAEVPPGNWGDVVWAPDCMWIAKWKDKLTGKTKYIWLHDSTPIKQSREAEKFDKALRLESKMDVIRQHIMDGLKSSDPRTREVAAACYLIDRLSLRVGDEKDPDEADTVGATTLRVEHLTFKRDSIVFDFLGKDSVPWHKELEMPPDVMSVFRELYERAKERLEDFRRSHPSDTSADPKKVAQIFPHIGSSHVNRFLSRAVPGLTAKMFRTHHATVTMRDRLSRSQVRKKDPEFMKKAAFKRANLEVARVMNHTKQAPKGWPKTEERYRLRIVRAEERIKKAERRLADAKRRLAERRKKERTLLNKKRVAIEKFRARVERARQKVEARREQRNRKQEALARAREHLREVRASRGRRSKTTKKERIAKARERVTKARASLERAEQALATARARYAAAREQLDKKRKELEVFKEKSEERIDKAKRGVECARAALEKARLAKKKVETNFAIARECRTWNLGTSLKSYVHPKIVYNWCNKVDLDWRKVYSKTLQRKFAWVENT